MGNPIVSSIDFSSSQIPLKNLFLYIRDLFNLQDPTFEFGKEKEKWWEIHTFQQLHDTVQGIGFNTQWNDPASPWISIQRVSVPPLHIPDQIRDWVLDIDQIEDHPQVHHKLEQVEKFEASFNREEAFDQLAAVVNGIPMDQAAHQQIPAILEGWIEVEAPEGCIQIHKRDRKERFEDDDLRVEMFQAFKRIHGHHYEAYQASMQINRLYDDLHALYYEIASQPEKQLSLSFGLVSGEIGHTIFHNYLFHIPLQIKLQHQTIEILPDLSSKRIEFEPGFTSLLPAHFSGDSEEAIGQRQLSVLKSIDSFYSENPSSSLDIHYIHLFHKYAREVLNVFTNIRDGFLEGDDLSFTYQPYQESKDIRLYFSPVIQVRKPEDQLYISKDADKIVSKITTLEEMGQTLLIPEYFRKLFALRTEKSPSSESAEIRVIYRHPSAKETLQETNPEIEETDKRFLFPLPFNDEQLAIAKRLEVNNAVTVKGPPGTGKSHTIANITSHYASSGKSVLIVSKNGKALDVIRDKLPSAIRDLTISLIQEGDATSRLKHTVDALKDRLSKRYSWEEVTKLNQKLEDIDRRIEKIQEMLIDTICLNDRELTIANPLSRKEETRTAGSWASYLNSFPQPKEKIEDVLEADEDVGKWLKDLRVAYKLAAHLPANIMDLSRYGFPYEEPWMRPEDFDRLCTRMKSIQERIPLAEYQQVSDLQLDTGFFRSWKDIQHHVKVLLNAHEWIHHPAFYQKLFFELLQKYDSLFHSVLEPWLAHEIDESPLEGEDPDVLLKQITQLIGKYKQKEQLSFLYKTSIGSLGKKFWQCKIDRLPVNTLSQLKILRHFIERKVYEKRLVIVLNNYFNSLDFDMESVPLVELIKEMQAVGKALRGLELENQELRKRKLPELDFFIKDFEKKIGFLAGLEEYHAYLELEKEWKRSIRILVQARSDETPPILDELMDAASNQDAQLYQARWDRYKEMRLEAERFHDLELLFEHMKKSLPNTTESIRYQWLNSITSGKNLDTLDKESWELAIFYQKIYSFLHQLCSAMTRTDTLFSQLMDWKQKKEQHTEKLITYKTWYFKSRQITDMQRSALTAWRNDLINIGKGYGKNTARHMQSAAKNMHRAKEAVPVWVMQQEMAIKFFEDPSPAQFDLLIIDEASQCDISMLNLIFRAKKCMIVGDENQTSVSVPPSTFPIDRTNRILDRYLYDHPYRQQFHINNRTSSIYTLSGVIYPNIITLQEHFRCHPDIIEYSNRYVYNRQIIPLKTSTDQYFSPALEVYFVECEKKDTKRKPIVKAIVEYVVNLLKAFEEGSIPRVPSMGVLTLDSSHETHREALIKALSANALIRKYADNLDMLIGTSRNFQGDERDVMILSSTSIHSITSKGNIRAPKGALGEEMMRIYNVAASRAKEKSVLFHCLSPEVVANINPSCYRRRLIEYYESAFTDHQQFNLKADESIVENLKTQKEKVPIDLSKLTLFASEVYTFLVNEDWEDKLFPNYTLGPYGIHIAVISHGRKLAIYCDGDPAEKGKNYVRELRNQAVLERAGWVSIRLQAVAWLCNGDQVKKDLLTYLERNIG